MSRLEEIDAQIAALQLERASIAQTEGRPAVFQILKPLFEYPGVESIYWTQYTPYFNDGDPCVFHVHFEPYINYDTEEDGDPEDQEGCFDAFSIKYALGHKHQSWEEADDYSRRYYNERQWNEQQASAAQEKVWFEENGWTVDLAEKFNDDCEKISTWMTEHEGFMLDAFGDHCFVQFKADGSFETDEHDHD